MFGFYGRIITLDLSRKTAAIERLPDTIYAEFLGGKGLATHLLLERNQQGVDPLSPANHLIIATGPFCQSRIWGGSRYGVYTKSPLTGCYAESYSGGRVPEAIDATGFDAILIRGRAERPTVIHITPEGATFHDAGDLWGRDVFETELAVVERFNSEKEEWDKSGAIVIGPAGEKLVRYAIIANDKWRCAGRTGVGAVMGAKRLKAIVFQGNRRRSLCDPKGVAAYAKAFSKANKQSPGAKAYRSLGTTMMVAVMNKAGAFPSKYWSQGSCEHWEKISGETYHREHDVKPHACAKCFMACGRLATIRSGRRKGTRVEGPEYETICSFGGLCMVEDITEIAYLNDLCDRLGMDTISAGNLCALAIEASARGKIKDAIAYGDVDAIANLLQQIAGKEGIGAILSEGIIHAAKEWELENIAIHVKGMEPAGFDPRVLKGMGLTFATSPRGACHLRTTFYKPELAGLIPPGQVEGKAEMLVDYEDRLNIFDTLILCRFYRDLYSWEELEKAIRLVTGLNLSKTKLREIASAITTLTRTFNLREGLGAEGDRLPKRLLKETLPSGHALTAAEMDLMVKDYYILRGWDQNGVPVQPSRVQSV
jgi:aldehyde:ferredoxin oxidoreductase